MSEWSLLEGTQGSSLLRREGEQQQVVASGMNPAEARRTLASLNSGNGVAVGEVFEWIAAASFVAAAYLWLCSIPLALLVFGICLAYFAQCYSTTRVHPRFLKPHLRRRPKAEPKPRRKLLKGILHAAFARLRNRPSLPVAGNNPTR